MTGILQVLLLFGAKLFARLRLLLSLMSHTCHCFFFPPLLVGLSLLFNGTRIKDQCSMWFELSKMVPLNLPRLIAGDFNTVSSRSDHKGGSFVYYSSKAYLFLSFITDNNYLDLYFSGFEFTWYKNMSGLTRQ